MKKIISSIISLAITLSLYPGSALVLAEKTGVSFGWTYVDGSDDVVTVPEEIDGKVVDDILLWHDCEEDPVIKKLVISSTVKTMDIGHLDSLEEYEVDENNPYFTTVDGVIYDKEMKKLVYYPPAKPVEDFKIPETVEIIGTNSFLFAENLESISVPENVKIIEEGAFAGSKIKNIDLKEGITDIEKYAFGGCSELEQIVLPESLERIGEAFGECTNLKKIIILHKDFEDNGPSSIIDPEKDNYYSILRECEGISVYVPDEEYEKYSNGIGDVESNILYKLSELSDPLYNGSSIFAKEDQSNTGTPATEESDIIFGDLDSDGAADLTDLSTLSLFLIGDTSLDDAGKKAADVDGDGEVKLADLAKFRQFLSKQIETLGPERQESETGDIQKLRSEYPEYFGLETFKGLEVYAWRDNSGEYCSVLMEGTNRNKEIEEITELRPLTIEEAKLIVNDYKVNKDDVIVIPIGLNSEKQLDFETDKESSDRITSYFKNDALLSITDLTVTNGIATDSAFEVFYEDDEYTYSFSTVKSEYVECTFIDGSKMKIKDALNKGSVNLSDLDLFGILYVKDEKTDSSEVSPLDKYFYDNNLQSYAEATVFERVEIDIDKDGKTEDCTFSSGITSGLYTVIISAYSDGNLKYRNTLNLCYYSHITFVESDGDVYLMRCNDESSSDNEAVMNKIYIENDCIVVDGLDEYEGYWGDEEFNLNLV